MYEGKLQTHIHENTYRIAADAVPCFEYGWYGNTPPDIGTAFMAGGNRIFNCPEQHYSNGVAKNTATARRFKAVVRVLKHLRYEMLNAGITSAKPVPSFLLERPRRCQVDHGCFICEHAGRRKCSEWVAVSDRVLIPLAGVGTLAMSREDYDAALEAGRELSRVDASPRSSTPTAHLRMWPPPSRSCTER
jgi:hypothetical protein